jgi:hypothetical protein
MTTKRLLVGGLFSLALGLFLWNGPVLAGAKPAVTQPARWVHVSSVGEQIVGMKKEITIDAATAANLFIGEFLRVREGWEKKIARKVESAADARSVPEDVKKIWIEARDKTAFAKVVKFSEKELILVVVEHKGTYLYHQYYECKARFRLPRGKKVDALFNVRSLEKTYGTRHKGLQQGDSVAKVTKKLGKPDATISYQPVGFYKLCYFKENVIITVDANLIESIELKVPQSVKDEVKKKGRKLIRY